jgi:hypothetical protein
LPAPRSGTSRRTVILGAAAVLTGAAVRPAPARAAPVYTGVPKLPGEVSRTSTKVTRLGKRRFETIDVVYATDRARLYVPWPTSQPGKLAQNVVWFYHSNGSSYTAIDGAFNYGAMMAIDQGAVCICSNFGGSLWTSQKALSHQTSWAAYVSSTFAGYGAFARANSGGGSLMTYAYAQDMVHALRGIYLANGSYDMEDLYARDPVRIGPVYGNDPALVVATNPARLPQGSWTGKRLKTVVSMADPITPPARHGQALADLGRPVAADVRVQFHDEGHVVPGWTHADMVSTFTSWL